MTSRGVFHGVIVLLGWILFIYWWNRILSDIRARDAWGALYFIGLTFILTGAATLLWVRYNIGIFRRKGPRRNLRAVTERRDADFLGRKIDAPGAASLRSAPVIVVSVDGGVKTFHAGGGT